MRAVVFLDRDGTINIDTGYVTSPQRVELIPGVADAIAKIREAGFAVVVVSNQSAVGRGMAQISDVEATNTEVQKQLLEQNKNAVLDQILFSTASPEQQDDTRKPGTGLIRQLRKDLNYSPKKSWVIGDKIVDIQFGINAGLSAANCILVLTGEGEKHRLSLPPQARVAIDLFQAATMIVDDK